MSCNFHVKDLTEMIEFMMKENTSHNQFVLDFTNLIDSNEKYGYFINKHYPFKHNENFLMLIGYEMGQCINFFKVAGCNIAMQLKICESRNDEIYIFHRDNISKYSFYIDKECTLYSMFQEIKNRYMATYTEYLPALHYCDDIDALEGYVTRLLKIYTRYIKTGKIREGG